MLDAIISGFFSVVIALAKCLFPPIGNEISYFHNYEANIYSLKEKVPKLQDERDSVQRRVDAATRNVEEIEQNVQTWMTSVDNFITEAEEFINEAEKIIEDAEKAKSLCFEGLCRPDWETRYQFGKNAAEKVKALDKLQQEGNFPQFSYKTIPQEKWLPATIGYESFQSRISTLNAIKNALTDPNGNMVGVYGIGGIGKTTLVREIAMKAETEKLFDKVVFAEVSQTPDIEKIQKEIADMLGLQFDDQSQTGRARRLRERLIREKKILIILDNIWTSLKMEDIGIPFGDDHKGCKLLLTARIVDVLSSENENNFPVGTLDGEEAWSLFKKMVGKDFEDPELRSIAHGVANECRGLPIAIVTIARALRNKSKYQWENALHELRNPSKRSFTGVQAKAYSTIEMSYNQLEDEDLKSTFLLCGVIQGFACTLDLFKYGMGLGILQSINTMEGARNRLYTLLHELKANCLLLDDPTGESFSMHDVVRDVALSIASRDQHVFAVRNEAGPTNWPNKDILKNCYSITLYRSNMSEFPEGLECPQLCFLVISDQNFFVKIPTNFFNGMMKLQVLDMSGMKLVSLPSSIQLLGDLRTLCLDRCELGDIAIVGELKKLEILSFNSSNIKQLPKEIGQLSYLKLLDLSNCYKLKVIPPNAISSLSQLEELYMGNTSIQWNDEAPNTERGKASLHELKNLSHLTNLEIHVNNVKILPKGLFSKKLKQYIISIGDRWKWYESYRCTRKLKLKCDTNICMEDIMQLKGIEVLYLDELSGVKNILYEVDRNGFPELKHLHVQNNPHLLCIVETMEWVSHEAFPRLESLLLKNLINLKKICCGQLTAKSFCKLNSITVDNCDKLKNIFSFSVVKVLPQLQTIKVIECDAMEEIFVIGKEDNVNNNEIVGIVELSQLRFLTLNSLPHHTSFCSKVKIPKDNEIILQDQYSTPTTLFNEMVAMPKLVSLEVSTINCEKICQLSAMSFCFKNLTYLIVQNCGNLKYLFSSIMSTTSISLEQLREIRLERCQRIIEVINEEDIAGVEIIFTKLEKLSLIRLESLTSFCSANYTFKFPALQELTVKLCPKMKIFCKGAFNTSQLGKVWLNGEQYSLKDDLNRTIKQMGC